MKITGNESAYPIMEEVMTSAYSDRPSTMMEVTSYGLTIRQQFAMSAMQGLAASLWECNPTTCAKKSVEYADALIIELNK